MQNGLLVKVCAAFLVCALCMFGCGKKAKGPARIDPHSADGVLLELQEQERRFQDAYTRKDYRYLHDWGYYFNGVLQAFYSQLDATQRQRLRGTFDELTRVTSQLDFASGGGRAAATEATVQRIQSLLQELERQYRETRPSG